MSASPRRSPQKLKPDLLPRLARKQKIDASTYAERTWGRLVLPKESIGWIWIVVVVFVVYFGMIASMGRRSEARAVDTSRDSKTTERQQALALEAVMRFMSPHSLNDRREVLRDESDLLAVLKHFERMENLHQEQLIKEVRPKATRFTRTGLVYHPFEILFSDNRHRTVAVIEEYGEYSIDWDAYARTPYSQWRELLNGERESLEVRVEISSTDYYNYQFVDDQQFESIRMDTPELNEPLFGYVQHGSETIDQLKDSVHWWLKFGKMTRVPVTLIIKSVDGSHTHRQFLISKFVADGFVENGIPVAKR